MHDQTTKGEEEEVPKLMYTTFRCKPVANAFATSENTLVFPKASSWVISTHTHYIIQKSSQKFNLKNLKVWILKGKDEILIKWMSYEEDSFEIS